MKKATFKEPKNVDFFVKSRPMTRGEEEEISRIIAKSKAESNSLVFQ